MKPEEAREIAEKLKAEARRNLSERKCFNARDKAAFDYFDVLDLADFVLGNALFFDSGERIRKIMDGY